MKSFLDLSNEELEEVINTGKFPDGVDLTSIVQDPNLYKFIKRPYKLAKEVLRRKGAGSGYSPSQKTQELKEKALLLKEKQIELQLKKIAKQTEFYGMLQTMNKSILSLREEVSKVVRLVRNLDKKGGE